ncbi:MAG: methionyl-tRNA formyltransferase [Actinomycetales bacterium]|nr:methionyl-tRNA formyltransferase [Actinomycetales bacterium]
MRIIFAGTPEVAVPTLRALVAAGHDVCAVLTRPDAPLGRKRILTPSPVATVALELGIPVLRAAKVDAALSAQLAHLHAELGVVVAYGGLLPQPALEAPSEGWINLHFSDLPRWRGAAPVQWSVIAGDTEIGTTVFALVAALDAGDVYSCALSPIGVDETAGELLTRLSVSGARQVCDVVVAMSAGTAVAVSQTGDATHARKLTLDDAHLNVNAPVDIVYAQLRGVTPEPGAFVEIAGERLKLHQAARPEDAPTISAGHIESRSKRVWLGTATQALELRQVQPAGKPRMSAADWFRGLHDQESVVAT